VATNDDDTFSETLSYTNGEMMVTLGQLFEVDPGDICRWAIVLTAHVPTEAPGTHDIRVASNCMDADIPTILKMGVTTMGGS
jgi:hypothetical protein